MIRLPKVPQYQVTGFWLSMPFIIFCLSYIMYEDRLFHEWKIWLVSYPIIYLIGYASWRSHSVYDYFLRSKYPSIDKTYKRVLYKLPVNLLVMTPSVLLIFYFFDYFKIMDYQIHSGDLKSGYLAGLTVNIIFESLWEVIYIIDKYKEVTAEKETIEQLSLQQEFNQLKRKVNPHFLFNCFNTLSSLISDDKVQAEKFLDELSKVYRYLLRNNESGMSTLEQEIQFIKSYFKLLKTRYGRGIELSINVHPGYMELQIPSLSLQLLLKNAVKHNVVSKSNPVHVSIQTTDDARIVVENNLNKKMNTLESTGIGLSNIKEKYRLLKQGEVSIEELANTFKVTIPLIQTKSENISSI